VYGVCVRRVNTACEYGVCVWCVNMAFDFFPNQLDSLKFISNPPNERVVQAVSQPGERVVETAGRRVCTACVHSV